LIFRSAWPLFRTDLQSIRIISLCSLKPINL
jgi:hypothetical protein